MGNLIIYSFSNSWRKIYVEKYMYECACGAGKSGLIYGKIVTETS